MKIISIKWITAVAVILVSTSSFPAMAQLWIHENADGTFHGDCDSQSAFSGSRSGEGYSVSSSYRSVYNRSRQTAITEACQRPSSEGAIASANHRLFRAGTFYCIWGDQAERVSNYLYSSRSMLEFWMIAARFRAEDGRENESDCRLLPNDQRLEVFDQNLDGEVQIYAAEDANGNYILLME